MLETFATWLVTLVDSVGYPGLFVAMFFGNLLVPIPVEAIMIPAGYLVQQGDMNLVTVMIVCIAGDVLGSLVAYYLAAHLGRRFLLKFGRYVLLKPERIEYLDRFFKSHGQISVLTGRLVPGLRHFMAFPAGLSHMHVKRFALYTGAGGGIWMATLLGVGYVIGGNKALVKHYMPFISAAVIAGVVVMVIVYTWNHRRKKKGNGHV